MPARTTSDGTENSASVGELVASIKDDVTALVRDEIALAKAELRQDARQAALGGAMAAAAGLLGLAGFGLGSVALVYGVSALGLTRGWSYLVVAGAYVLVALALLVMAKGRFDRMTRAERAKVAARDAARTLLPGSRQGAAGRPGDTLQPAPPRT